MYPILNAAGKLPYFFSLPFLHVDRRIAITDNCLLVKYL